MHGLPSRHEADAPLERDESRIVPCAVEFRCDPEQREPLIPVGVSFFEPLEHIVLAKPRADHVGDVTSQLPHS